MPVSIRVQLSGDMFSMRGITESMFPVKLIVELLFPVFRSVISCRISLSHESGILRVPVMIVAVKVRLHVEYLFTSNVFV